MHKTEITTVLPGVQFAYIPAEEYKNASFAVGFRYGSKRGCSSSDLILCHLLCRSSADYPDERSFSRRLEELFATDLSVQSIRQGDCRASLFQATFLDEPFASGVPAFTREVLSFLSCALLRPAYDKVGAFRLDAIEREKSALLDRIRSIKNSKSAYAYARLSELSADPVRYDVPDYGTEEEVAAVTPALLRARYREMLFRSEVCFVYAGSLSSETVLSLIRELFGKILTPRKPLSGRICMSRRAPHAPILRVREETDGEQAMLGLSFRIPTGFGEPGSEYVPTLSAVLSDAPMSLLFSEVREKGGYCYSIRAQVRLANRELLILCGIAPGTERRVERAVSRVLSDLRAGKVDSALLSAAKSYVRMTVSTVFDSIDATVHFVLFRRLFHRKTDPEELISDAEHVTVKTLSDYLKKVRSDVVYLLTPTMGGDRNG